MFITRASRHDRADIEEFLEGEGWTGANLRNGATFFARDGGVVGCLRLVEVEPRAVVVEDMVVARARRREGIGRSLMQAAMNSRGGTLYVRCAEDLVAAFERLGFARVDDGDVPPSVRSHMAAASRSGGVALKAR